jgi:UDP-N-acetylglucosamine--N-acetylmuramyl-(pentapeptide) pyrophosphoryl-undecaprenol N-acetylglucosamine transferase
MRELNRLIVSCGGTGGHFNPGLSTACAFRDAGGAPLLILGGKHFEEQSKAAEKNGIEYRRVSCAPLSKKPSGMIRFLSQQMRGVREARAIFREFKPDAVLSMGAFPSIPASLGAWRGGVPLFLHDGNARIGKSNRVFSRIASGIALSFPAINGNKLHCPSAVTGLPLRKALLEDVPASKAEAVERINATRGTAFAPDRPVVLVFGGSLGATAINENFTIPIDHPGAKSLQVIHLSGPGKYDAIHDKYSACGVNALTLESASDMQNLYMAADLVVCRAGGSTVSELAIFGRYAVLIPYPYAAEGHQDDNARLLAKTGAARIVPNAECSPAVFRGILAEFLDDPGKFREAGKGALAMAQPRAAENVIEFIENSLKKARSKA